MEYNTKYEQYLDNILNPNSSEAQYENAKKKVTKNFQYYLERGSNPNSVIAYRGASFGLTESDAFLSLLASIIKTKSVDYNAISFWSTIPKTAVYYASAGSYGNGKAFKIVLVTKVPSKSAISTQRYYANMLDLDKSMNRDVNLILPDKRIAVEIASISAIADKGNLVYNNKKYSDAALAGKIKAASLQEFIDSL
jgi:hypothetical protein